MKRSFLLLLLAIVGTLTLAPIFFIVQTIRNIKKDTLAEFYFGLALSLDYLGAYLLFGAIGHTISALVVEKKHNRAISFINWIFGDPQHCQKEWNKEFGRGNKRW